MNREYFVRGQRKTVEEIDNISAIKVTPNERGEASAGVRTFGTAARVVDVGMPEDTAEAFEKALWLFVKPSSTTSRALDARELPPSADGSGKLVKRPNGRFGIVTRRLNVQLDANIPAEEAEQILAERGLKLLARLRFAPNLFEVDTLVHADALAASVELSTDPRFTLAEPSFIEHVPVRLTPTDPRFGDQWQWANTGQNGGTAGADVSAEEAWDHTRGAGIRVAVIDNGFNATHEDLQAGVVGVSGFFQANGANPEIFVQGTAGMPGSNHGTFCAGMVGSRHNNTVGGCGAAPECELILIACLGDQVGTQTTLARAVSYAADPSMEVEGADPATGADILVCSLGPNGADWDLTVTLELAIEAAATNGRNGRGLAVFWAASNGNNVNVMQDEVVSHADVIAVVRSTRMDLEDNAARGAAVELIAPGVDVFSTTGAGGYGTGTGTSYAAPCAAGCAALALSANPDLTRDQLRTIMRETADQIGGVVYDANGHNDDYGFGRVNADSAVRRAALRVTLETASVAFNDIPEDETTARAVVWQCFSVEPLTFQIVSGPATTTGPANSFQTLLGAFVTIPAPGFTVGAKARLWLTYRGGAPGSTASGTVRVRCVETAEEWDVALTANAIERPKTAVVMVLDQSGSMDWDAGDGRKRVDVLREAARNFVDVIQPENGVGVVRFDHNAYLGMAVAEAGPEVFGPGRAAATAQVAGHTPNPMGATSIGDGIEMAAGQLDTVVGYDRTAMIVLTDGQENAPKLIADVAGSVDDRTFAIGLGRPEDINPQALNAVTNGTGGYVVMTGNLSADEYFVLSKYYLQILAGVTNQEIVLDPSGHLQPGNMQKVPFSLNEADAGADVIILAPAPLVLRATIETPTGEMLTPGALPAGMKFVAGMGVAYFRFNLPVVTAGGRPAWAGRWVLHLDCDKGGFRKYLNTLERDPKAYEYTKSHGLRWSVVVQARSSLKFDARLHQKDITLGSWMHLVARLAEYGLPVEGRAEVVAELVTPSGAMQEVRLKETAAGQFEADVVGSEHGVYRYRVVAGGKTLRGSRFTREQTLTGSIYIVRPPVDPKPPQEDGDDRPCAKRIAALLEILAGNRRLAALLERDLERYGIKLAELVVCLEAAPKQAATGGTARPPRPVQPVPIVRPITVLDRPLPSPSPSARNVAIADALRTIADTLDEE
jgi:subtilisin family serine protease